MKLEIPKNVLCVAAVKYASVEQIESIIKEGFTTLGWSTVQQFQKIAPLLPAACKHHFIGHLQKNKVKQLLASKIELIESVDSLELLKCIDRVASEKNKKQHVFLQVRTDATKEHGFSFEEIDQYFSEMLELKSIGVDGLMTIPPATNNPETNQNIFRKMKEEASRLSEKYHHPLLLLSMGMSDDYQIAIEEGATIVRLGRILFEKQL